MTLIVTEGIYASVLRIYHGEDLVIALPRFVDPMTVDPSDPTSGDPWDITDVDIHIFIRPAFNHPTRFKVLTTIDDAGIIKDGPTEGLATVFLPQLDVEADLPLTVNHWDQFMRIRWTDADLGLITKLIARGPCFVYPNLQAATP